MKPVIDSNKYIPDQVYNTCGSWRDVLRDYPPTHLWIKITEENEEDRDKINYHIMLKNSFLTECSCFTRKDLKILEKGKSIFAD